MGDVASIHPASRTAMHPRGLEVRASWQSRHGGNCVATVCSARGSGPLPAFVAAAMGV